MIAWLKRWWKFVLAVLGAVLAAVIYVLTREKRAYTTGDVVSDAVAELQEAKKTAERRKAAARRARNRAHAEVAIREKEREEEHARRAADRAAGNRAADAIARRRRRNS